MLERAGGPAATPGPPGGGGLRGLPFNLPVPPPASGQSMAGAHRALAAFHPCAGRSKRISAFGKADRGSAAKAARIQAIACPRRKEHPPGRIPSSRAAGFRRLKGSSGPSRISARRPRRDRQRSADGGAAHPGESGRIGPLPGARMLTPDRPASASKAQAADSENTPTSFPSTSERMRQPPRRRRNEGGPKKETRTDDRAGSPPKRRKLPYLNHDIAFPPPTLAKAEDGAVHGAGRGQAEGMDGPDQETAGRRAGRAGHRRPEAAPRPVRSRRGLPTGSGIAESACNCIARTGSNSREAAGRKRAPTPCPPSDAASKTCVGPTSSIGGLAAPQPPNQRKWTAPHSERALARGLDLTYVPPSRIHSVRETVLPICPYEAGGCGPSASRRRS